MHYIYQQKIVLFDFAEWKLGASFRFNGALHKNEYGILNK